MARIKHVFPTHEIPHLWAHRTQEDARNPQGNLYFKGATIYSYRDSYPIASHVTNSKEGKAARSAVLIRTDSYSVTTSGHISAVRQSVPSGVTRFYVPSVQVDWCWSTPGPDHDTNLAYFVEQAKESFRKAQNSRKYGTSELQTAFGYRDTAAQYAKFFGLAPTRKMFSFLPNAKVLAALRLRLTEREDRAKVLDQARFARERVQREERARIQTLDDAEQIELWRKGNPHAHVPWNAPTMLRIKGSEVETSRGARVPMAHALRALSAVRRVVESGQEFIPNGHTLHVGHYTVDRIEANGTLHAGCHVITLEEIERIAPELMALEVPCVA
jgi:hypothetical protein